MPSPVIVVGLDNSSSSAAAIRWAAGEAVRLGAHVVAVHAWELPARADLRPASRDLDDERAQIRERACAWVLDALVRTGIDVAVTVEVKDGLAGPTLVAAAKDAELLVLGAGQMAAEGLRQPSSEVVDYCLRHASCRVVVIEGPRAYPRLAPTPCCAESFVGLSQGVTRWPARAT